MEYTPTGINQLIDDIKSYSLADNYPNPFNPSTTIRYQVPKRSEVSVKVFSLLGRKKTLINREQEAGEYEIEFDAENLPSGKATFLSARGPKFHPH